jgi:hypothetical protein
LVTGFHAFDWRFGGWKDSETGLEWGLGDIQLGCMADKFERKIPIEMREKSQYWDKYLDEEG